MWVKSAGVDFSDFKQNMSLHDQQYKDMCNTKTVSDNKWLEDDGKSNIHINTSLNCTAYNKVTGYTSSGSISSGSESPTKVHNHFRSIGTNANSTSAISDVSPSSVSVTSTEDAPTLAWAAQSNNCNETRERSYSYHSHGHHNGSKEYESSPPRRTPGVVLNMSNSEQVPYTTDSEENCTFNMSFNM